MAETVSHTPGPWDVNGEGPTVARLETSLSRFDILITAPHISRFDKLADEAHDADARLIAAAPEMLLGLKEASDWISGQHEARWSAMVARIRSIIVMAEGEM